MQIEPNWVGPISCNNNSLVRGQIWYSAYGKNYWKRIVQGVPWPKQQGPEEAAIVVQHSTSATAALPISLQFHSVCFSKWQNGTGQRWCDCEPESIWWLSIYYLQICLWVGVAEVYANKVKQRTIQILQESMVSESEIPCRLPSSTS